MSFQAVEQCPVGRLSCSRLVQHDNVIATDNGAMLPERLTDDALQSVSSRGQAAILLADGHAKPGLFTAIRAVENGKHFVAAAFRFCEDATEGGLVDEPTASPEAAVRRVAGYCFSIRNLGGLGTTRYGVSFARPLARRRFNTRRPAFVAIRALNPCVRARLILLG